MSSPPDDPADEGTVIMPTGGSAAARGPGSPAAARAAATPGSAATAAAAPVPVAAAGAAAVPEAPAAPPAVVDTPDPPTWGPVTTQSFGPREAGNALPLGTRLGEFTLTRVIGEGGFGIVYEAHDASLDRRVAVKEYMPADLAERTANLQVRCLDDEDEAVFAKGLESFINEAKILARFDHPSLVKVYRFWEAHGTAYMVMPYYEGPTLLDALRRLRRPPDEAWLMGLLEPLTEALAVIHEARVYHRDIAPDNILLLAGSGLPLLLDFGAARRVIEGAQQRAPTAIVKPGYAPIEQYAEVNMGQGPWSDLYALAAVLHFALTGRKPPAAIGRLVSDSRVPLATQAAGRYSPALLAAIDKAMVVAPGERTQTVDAFRAAIGLAPLARDATGALVIGGSAPASPHAAVASAGEAADGERSSAAGGRQRTVWAVAGAVLLATAAAAAWWLAGRTGETAPSLAQGPTVPPAPSAPAAAPPPVAPPAAAPPATPAETPAATTATTSALSVADEFARIVARSTPGYTVGLSWRPAPRFRIGRGDVLALDVTSTEHGYLYVLVHTPDQLLFQYFPNDAARANVIQRHTVVSLPRRGTDPRTGLSHEGIAMTEPPGLGHVLVIVSKHPRDFSALGARREAVYPVYPVGDEALALHRRLGDAGPIYLGRVQCPPGPPCDDRFGATTDHFEILR